MRSSIIKKLNTFIVDATTITNENRSVPAVLNVDSRAGMTRYLNDDGLCVMLEAIIIRKLDNISPFSLYRWIVSVG